MIASYRVSGSKLPLIVVEIAKRYPCVFAYCYLKRSKIITILEKSYDDKDVKTLHAIPDGRTT